MGPARCRQTLLNARNVPALVADHHDRFANDVHGKKCARIGDRAFCAVHFAARLVERSNQLPRSAKDAFFFERENGGIDVEARGQRFRALHPLIHPEVDGFGGHRP